MSGHTCCACFTHNNLPCCNEGHPLTERNYEQYGPRRVEERWPQVSIRYARYGTVSHIVWDDATTWPEGVGICGRTNLDYGTGTWAERIKARRMPLCIRCSQSDLNRSATNNAHGGAA